MNKIYEKPILEIAVIDTHILTNSPEVPEFDSGDNELPKQDW